MRQKKSNAFGTLRYMGVAILAVPVLMILVFVVMYMANRKPDAPFSKTSSEDIKKEKVVEKVYIHDTVEIPCKRKHCDDHTQKKPEVKAVDTTPINKPDTLK